jgi:radical SAM superfamily enzyme YgiQ (UPF0313 family)
MKKHGIKPCYFLQFGYPGEAKAEIQETIRLMLEEMPYDIGISVSYPLPGTKFYEMVKTDLSDKTNWTDSDELAMMFQGNYPPTFYKILHRYVHRRFRRAQAAAYFRKKDRNKSETRRMILWPYYYLGEQWQLLRMRY